MINQNFTWIFPLPKNYTILRAPNLETFIFLFAEEHEIILI